MKTKLKNHELSSFVWDRLKSTIANERPLLMGWIDAVKSAQLFTDLTPAVLMLTFRKKDAHAQEALMRPVMRQFLQSRAETITGEPIVISTTTNQTAL